jgi:hypothetical protein
MHAKDEVIPLLVDIVDIRVVFFEDAAGDILGDILVIGIAALAAVLSVKLLPSVIDEVKCNVINFEDVEYFVEVDLLILYFVTVNSKGVLGVVRCVLIVFEELGEEVCVFGCNEDKTVGPFKVEAEISTGFGVPRVNIADDK